ncbi:MAG: CPBP family intramembrane metalloprotease [Flavobacteriales bacterium]|nr:CPBP family intramembrane metalloprotease [Flavobacteriales bacterium]
MLGLIIEIALSWLILWLVFREHITVLGIKPTAIRLKQFAIGMLIMAALCLINQLSQANFSGVSYVRNPTYGWIEALNGTYWTIKAALFEEFIFRGAILYFLIRKIGGIWACVISAIAFGIYHWFSYNMFERGLVPMVYVFLMTGAAGYMFAYSFYKTKSIWVPFGLHFGWIVISIVFFSDGPLGESMYIASGEGEDLSNWEQLWAFVYQALVVPIALVLFVQKYFKS